MLTSTAEREMRRSELALLFRSSGSAPFCRPHSRQPYSPPLYGVSGFSEGDLDRWSIPLAWQLRGLLHYEQLERAAAEVLRRQRLLGCTLVCGSDGWQYRTDQIFHVPLLTRRIERGVAHAQSAALAALREEIWRPIRLSAQSSLRLIVVSVDEDDHRVAAVINHAFADAYSTRLFSYELAVLYERFCRGAASPLPEPSLQFLDYMRSVEDWCRGAPARDNAAYWASYLEGAQPPEYPKAEPLSLSTTQLSGPLSKAIRSLSTSERVTLNTMWEALHHVALAGVTGLNDITTRSVDIGRRQRELLGVIGPFAGTVPIRTVSLRDITFQQLLAQISAGRRVAAPRLLWADALRPFAFLKFDFPKLNYIPEAFWFLPGLGETLPLTSLGPIPLTPFEREKQRTRYNIIVREQDEFEIQGDPQFIERLKSLTRAVTREPDRVMLEIIR